MSDWTTERLGTYARTFAGGTPDRSRPDFFGGTIPWVKSTEVNLGKIYQTEEHLSELGLKCSATKWIPENTVLVALYGATAAQVGFLKIKATANQAVLAICPDERLDSTYLFYSLTAAKARVLFQAQGSGQPNLNKQIIDNLHIAVPPLPQQRKIARILTTVDNLIEKTEALIAKYQSIKQGMMHDLFTRGLDANGHLRPPYAQAPQLYKHSELGWIPKEWEAQKLGYALQTAGGYLQTGPFGSQLHSYEYVHEGIPVVMPQDITAGRISTEQIARITKSKADSMVRHRLQKNDVVFSRRGDLSRAAAISTTEDGWICGTGCFLLRCPTDRLNSNWIARQYEMPHVQKQVDANAVGSTMPSLNNGVMERLLMLMPDATEQAQIGERVVSMELVIDKFRSELNKLSLTKTGLMQDLLTGKVRVTVDELDEVA